MNNGRGGGGSADDDEEVSSYEPSEDDATEYDELFRSGFPTLIRVTRVNNHIFLIQGGQGP